MPALRIEWMIEYLNDDFLKTERRTTWLSIEHGHSLKQMTWEVGNREETLEILEQISIKRPERK